MLKMLLKIDIQKVRLSEKMTYRDAPHIGTCKPYTLAHGYQKFVFRNILSCDTPLIHCQKSTKTFLLFNAIYTYSVIFVVYTIFKSCNCDFYRRGYISLMLEIVKSHTRF